LPEGNSKEDAIKKKVRLEYKKFLLENRKESYGVVALLEKELDLTNVTQSLTEIDAFTAAITARKVAF
jgi:spore coat protein CotH